MEISIVLIQEDADRVLAAFTDGGKDYVDELPADVITAFIYDYIKNQVVNYEISQASLVATEQAQASTALFLAGTGTGVLTK